MRSNHSYNFCDLNLVLVVYTKMSVCHFVLNALETSVIMGLSGSMETAAIPTLDASAVAVIQVSVDDMKAVFKYQTDSYDFTDLASTDIKYYVDSEALPALNPANAMLDASDSSGAITSVDISANKQLVAHDFVRYLATKLFNTYHGVDLFNNEVALLQNLRSICSEDAEGNAWKTVRETLAAVGMTADPNGADAIAGLASNGTSSYMTNANSGPENICRVLFEQMTKTAISRFGTSVADSDAMQSIPFEANDSISFKLTINPAEGQNALTGVSEFGGRSYEIRLLLVADPQNTEVDALET